MPGIQKQWLSKEEFAKIQGGNWTPSPHTHIKTDITDTPWAWADVLKAGSNLTDLEMWQHASEHEVGGGDLIDFASLTGFGTYLDQAVLQASNVVHASMLLNNTGLHVLDTNASHYLTIKPGSNITANRILTLTTGDAARTITLSGNPTLADWFDQAVKQASSPTFANLNLGATPSIRQLSGALTIQTNEGVNTWTIVDIKGKGTSPAELRIFDGDEAEYLDIWIQAGRGYIKTGGTSPGRLELQYSEAQDIVCWSIIAAGNPYFYIYGFKAADAVKYLRTRVEADGDALIEAENDLNLRAGGGDINLGDENLTTTGIMKAQTFHLTAGVTPNLAWLSDVTLGTLEEGETIRYDQTTAKFIDAWGIDYDNPRLVYKIYTDFFKADNDLNDPWEGVTIGGGTMASVAGTSNHPGIIRLSSIATATTGYRFMTAVNCFLIAGAEHSEFCFKTGASLLNIRVRLGFQDSLTSAAPTDGVWIDITGATLTGKTSSNGALSTTGTNYGLAVNTWYRGKIAVNSDATEVVFLLYTDVAGEQTVVWTDTLAANIPTAAGRETGHGVVVTVAANVARFFDADMMIATRAGYIER